MPFRFGQSPLRISPDLFSNQRFSAFSEPQQDNARLTTRPVRPVYGPPEPIRGGPVSQRPYRGLTFGEGEPTLNQTIEDMSRPTVEPLAEQDEFDRLAGSYKPSYAAMTQYQDVLGEMPQRTRPGAWSSIFGALAGVGAGLQGRVQDIAPTMERIMYGPYQRQLGDWKTKVEAYGEAADIESKQNQMSTQWINAISNLYEGQNLAKRRTAQTEIDFAKLQQRANEQADKMIQAINAGATIKPIGGRMVIVNPRNPSAAPIDLGEDMTAALSKERLAELKRHNIVTEAQGGERAAQGWAGLDIRQQQADIAGIRAQGYLNNIESLINNRSSDSRTGLSPLEEQREHRNAINTVKTAKPQYRALFDDWGQLLEDAEDDNPELFRQFYSEYRAERARRNAEILGQQTPTAPKLTVPPRQPRTPRKAPTGTTVPETTPGTINFSNLPRR